MSELKVRISVKTFSQNFLDLFISSNMQSFTFLFHFYLTGAFSKTAEGEEWVWQFRREDPTDSDEEDEEEPELILIFATVYHPATEPKTTKSCAGLKLTQEPSVPSQET